MTLDAAELAALEAIARYPIYLVGNLPPTDAPSLTVLERLHAKRLIRLVGDGEMTRLAVTWRGRLELARRHRTTHDT